MESIVAVADNTGLDTAGIQLAFTPGDPYPIQGNLRLYVRDQPFPRSGPPTRVVPTILSVSLSYGYLGQGQQPAPVIPDEHWLRELRFEASYLPGSWQVAGDEATLDLVIGAGLRDNTPSGPQEPDDPFVAFLVVQALCIWTTETNLLRDFTRVLEEGLQSVLRRI